MGARGQLPKKIHFICNSTDPQESQTQPWHHCSARWSAILAALRERSLFAEMTSIYFGPWGTNTYDSTCLVVLTSHGHYLNVLSSLCATSVAFRCAHTPYQPGKFHFFLYHAPPSTASIWHHWLKVGPRAQLTQPRWQPHASPSTELSAEQRTQHMEIHRKNCASSGGVQSGYPKQSKERQKQWLM